MIHPLPRSADWDELLNAAARDPCWSHQEVLHWDTRWWARTQRGPASLRRGGGGPAPARSRRAAQIHRPILTTAFHGKVISFYRDGNSVIAKPPPGEAGTSTTCHPETPLKLQVHFLKIQTMLHSKYRLVKQIKTWQFLLLF